MDERQDDSGSASFDPTYQTITDSGIDVEPVGVDLQALADAIYALLSQELRLERERLGSAGRY